MIPNRFHFYTFSFFMSLLMSGVMSLATLFLEPATLTEMLSNWPKAWTISMIVAFPVSMLIVPLAQRLVSILVSAK